MNDDTQLLRGAELLIDQANKLADRGDERDAQLLQARAERLYEAAGLDPAWHDAESLPVGEVARPQGLQSFALDDGTIELTDEADPEAEPSGVFCTGDDLVDVEP